MGPRRSAERSGQRDVKVSPHRHLSGRRAIHFDDLGHDESEGNVAVYGLSCGGGEWKGSGRSEGGGWMME